MMIMLIEDHIGIRAPLKEGDIQVKVEGHLNKEDIWIEDLLGEDIPIEMEGLPGRGGYPGGGPPDGGGPPYGDGGPPNGDGGPPDGGGPLKMEDSLDPPVDKDHQALKDPLGQ